MRLVRRFTSALARIMALKTTEQYPEALEAVDQAYQELFGVNSQFIIVLSEKDLLALMQSGGGLDPDKAIVMAGLLKVEAEIYERQNRGEESQPRNRKALNLLLEAALSGRETSFPDLNTRIEELIGKIPEGDMPEVTKERIAQYHM